jgi:hypothetical protein
VPRSVLAAVARDGRFSAATEVTGSRGLKGVSAGTVAESVRDQYKTGQEGPVLALKPVGSLPCR